MINDWCEYWININDKNNFSKRYNQSINVLVKLGTSFKDETATSNFYVRNIIGTSFRRASNKLVGKPVKNWGSSSTIFILAIRHARLSASLVTRWRITIINDFLKKSGWTQWLTGRTGISAKSISVNRLHRECVFLSYANLFSDKSILQTIP